MKEYMLILRETEDKMASMRRVKKKEFLELVQVYIETLKNEGRLKGAQPLEGQGRLISGTKGKIKDEPFEPGKDYIIGYYHILANNIDEAIAIAKQNPEFEYGSTTTIEVRPIKMKEELIDYVYPQP